MDFHDEIYLQQLGKEFRSSLKDRGRTATALRPPRAKGLPSSKLAEMKQLMRELLKIRIRLTVEFVHTYPEGANR